MHRVAPVRRSMIAHRVVSDRRRTMKKDERIRIELTEEQKKQLKETSGKDVKALEFTVEELEARIAPWYFK
jgi:hypothetical protein